jgi:hypothetical protein
MLDLFLSDKYKADWDNIVKLAQKDDADSRAKLRKYALEGGRIATQSFGLFRDVAKATSVTENGKTTNLQPGQEIFVNLVPTTPYLPSSHPSHAQWLIRLGRCKLGSSAIP